jgi:parallel beta-helix repeat protein
MASPVRCGPDAPNPSGPHSPAWPGTLPTGRIARWTISPLPATVAFEVIPIFESPARTVSAAPPVDPSRPSEEIRVVGPAVRPTPRGNRHQTRRRVLAGASIVALVIAGATGLRPSLPAGAGPDGGPPAVAAAPFEPDGPPNALATDAPQPPSAPTGVAAETPSASPTAPVPTEPGATKPAPTKPAPTARTGGSTATTPNPTPAPAAVTTPLSRNRWVATTGSDAADGSATRPWRTIQHAVDVAAAGAVITVRGGTYAHFAVKRSGLVIQGASGETAIVSGSTYPVLVKGVSSATIRHLTIQKAPDQYGSGIRVEASRSVKIENNRVRDNHSFGIKVKDATGVLIRGNEISGNDTGIELSGSVGGAVISANRIHHNDHMVTSSRGGNGIVFTKTTGVVTVSGNRLWGNRARHMTDSGYDGGAFEVYGASDLRITGNIMWDNNNVMETGTDGSASCSRITFTRNVAYGPGTVAGETQGLILRCASSSLFANNTFDGIDTFAFYVSVSGSYAGSISGLRIENNIVVRGRAYSLGKGLPSNIVIDHDLAFPGGSTAEYANHLAYVEGHGNTDSLAEFRSWTGHDAHGVQADARFVDRAKHDYRLRTSSPAIDAGAVLGGAFSGKAPDIGRFEVPS